MQKRVCKMVRFGFQNNIKRMEPRRLLKSGRERKK
jgi:hypothetical protein